MVRCHCRCTHLYWSWEAETTTKVRPSDGYHLLSDYAISDSEDLQCEIERKGTESESKIKLG